MTHGTNIKKPDLDGGLRALPVLMFHSVSPPLTRVARQWVIHPAKFRRFASHLADGGFTSITIGQTYEKMSNPRIILTFDDGYKDFHTEAFPVMERLGLRASVFVVVDQIGKTNGWDDHLLIERREMLTIGEIRELHGRGVSFGSHSLSHRSLPILSDRDLRREIVDSKLRLEDLIGSEVTSFAYPYGHVDNRVRGFVAKAGYKYAMGVGPGLNKWDDSLNIPRISISSNDNLLSLFLKVRTGLSASECASSFLIGQIDRSLGLLPTNIARPLREQLRSANRAILKWRWSKNELRMIRPNSTTEM